MKEGDGMKWQMPIGVDNFFDIRSKHYYFVDKTDFIRQLIDGHSAVTLITRPRRFGKTLTLSMLEHFFSVEKEAQSRRLFDGLAIEGAGAAYMAHRGQYPVLFLSLKDLKDLTWPQMLQSLSSWISYWFIDHEYLAESPAVNPDLRRRFLALKKQGAGQNEMQLALTLLVKMMHQHFGKPVILLLDEYDAPIQQAWEHGFYTECIAFMKQFLGSVLKGNRDLDFAVLTGVLRVAKESIFSDLNNLDVCSVMDAAYRDVIGFTPQEVAQMAEDLSMTTALPALKAWYDGYLFGKTEIFNPWSVVSYFSNKCEPRPFWVSTGSNDVIGEVLAVADNEIYDRLTSLVNGETFTTFIDTDVIYPQIKSNPSTIYSFLLMTGYLKVLNTSLSFNGDFLCEVALPNREISLVYNKEILQRMENIIPQATAISIQEATFSGDHKRLKSQLQMLLTQSVSFFDTAGENFYHGFMLGLCALMSGTFATSNRESGDGRYDIQLKPIRKGMPGILIELKAGKNCSDEELKNMSEAALKQITDKKYDTEMKNAGIQTIYKYGVAFSGKNVEIAVE